MKAIIFDFDGVIHNTLLDLHKVHLKTLSDLSLEDYRIKVFSNNPREYLSDKFSKEQISNFEEEWMKVFYDLKIEENVKNVILKLKEKYELFIISSNTEKNISIYFNNSNFTDVFKKIYGVETHRSKVEKFKILFKEFNLKKGEVIFITDTLGDILEANEVGVRTIAVDFGFHKKALLEKGKPWKIISNIEDLLEII